MSESTHHLFKIGAEHVAMTTDDWYTPHWVFEAAQLTFDMDVSAPVEPQHRTVPARRYLTVIEDGLVADWGGVIWCNPPYSGAAPWVDRWAGHPDGLILLPTVPEVAWLGVALANADAFTLLSVDFLRPDGTRARLRWPNILAARGSVCVDALARIASADKYARGAYTVKAGGAA